MRMRVLAALTPLLLASCGGGGGDDGPPVPTNAAPTFTSLQTASVVENTKLAQMVTVNDPDGDATTLTVDGGPDAARFVLQPNGRLEFREPPDHDAPEDANGDNVFSVQLRVSDSVRSTTQTVNITVTNSREGIAVARVGTGFNQPLYVAAIPGDSRVYVVEKGGKVYRFDPANGSRTLVLDITDISTSGERGLLGLAPYPNHASSQRLFAVATAPDGTIQVRRYTLGQPNSSTSYDTVLSIPHPNFDNHNGGWIGFGDDGYVYVAVGDGGGGGDPNNNAQNPNSRLGKILRFTTGFDGSTYAPAPGNPFLAGGGDPYVYALGFRNPFRASFGPGGLMIADVGEGAVEEINMTNMYEPGYNFGWPFFEGTKPFKGTTSATLVKPVAEYNHGSGPREGRSVVGGYVYRGPVASLVNHYVFADFVSNNIWSIRLDKLRIAALGTPVPGAAFPRRNDDFAPDAGTISSISSFGEDSAGNLFIVSLGGDIFMVKPAT